MKVVSTLQHSDLQLLGHHKMSVFGSAGMKLWSAILDTASFKNSEKITLPYFIFTAYRYPHVEDILFDVMLSWYAKILKYANKTYLSHLLQHNCI